MIATKIFVAVVEWIVQNEVDCAVDETLGVEMTVSSEICQWILKKYAKNVGNI